MFNDHITEIHDFNDTINLSVVASELIKLGFEAQGFENMGRELVERKVNCAWKPTLISINWTQKRVGVIYL